MSRKTVMRTLMLLTAFSLCGIGVAAQDDAPSVAEAARRARQHKQDSAKPAHVIDNDTLTPASSNAGPAQANPPQPTPAPSTNDANSAVVSGNATGNDTDKSAADEGKKGEIDALKRQIAEKKASIDLQQREMALAQDSFYSNPDHEHDKAGKEKLEAMKSDLAQAQSELADLQAKLSALGPGAEAKSSATESSKP